MRMMLLLHLLSVATWLGCILTEVLYERSIDPAATMRRFISTLHWNTDKYIEIPAFLAVLLSGGVMLHGAAPTPLLWVKIALGITAIAFNAACVVMVFKRMRLADAADFAGWEKADHLQHKLGAVVLLTLLAALGIGGYVLITV